MPLYVRDGGVWKAVKDEGLSARHLGVWKPVKRLYVSVWTYPEGEPPVHEWKLVEDWGPPQVTVPNAVAQSAGGSAWVTWTNISNPNDPRHGYGVQVIWFDDDTQQSIPGAEDNVPQGNGQTLPRNFPSGVQWVFAQVRYTNAYGLGPTSFTNAVFVGGV